MGHGFLTLREPTVHRLAVGAQRESQIIPIRETPEDRALLLRTKERPAGLIQQLATRADTVLT